jgi:DNA repair exonuclease SbcCD ATPase subunit
MITSRLPSPEQQPVVIENLEDAIEAAFRRYIPDPDRYDEVFTRSIDKAAGVVEERFANLARSYESTLSDLTGQLSSSVATAGDSLQSAFQRMIQDLQGEEDKLIAKRKDMGSEEVDRFKEAMKEIYASVQEQVKGYQSKVAELQQATSESSQHALSAAEALGQRMQELTKMASAIEDLLHIEQAVEKGVQGIAAGEDFQQTLSALREHLAATDEFCNRMSKPRVITLREEPA